MVIFLVKDEDFKELQKVAMDNKMTVSDFIKLALDEAIKKYSGKNTGDNNKVIRVNQIKYVIKEQNK
jgi:predicted DNA-binding ribbon-helix-helix protein